jgi:putative spermidine/putrescine transport system permease protein
MTKLLPLLGRTYVITVLACIFAPLLIIFVISFSADDYLSFPPSSWSFRWYAAALTNAQFLSGMRNSAIIALCVSLLSVAFGLPAAWALARLQFRGRQFINAFIMMPLVLPSIVLALGILMVFTPLALTATYPGLVIAHLTLTLPFTIRILQTALMNLGMDPENAALTLGATPVQTFVNITVPRILPGVFASASIAAILSFDEIVLSLFIVGPRLSTLPVEIYRYVDERTDPLVAVLAVLLIVLSLGIVMIVERTIGFTRAFGHS